MEITRERAKEILNKFKKDNALFNWCEEYKQFVQDNVLLNMNSEIEYILKQSDRIEDEEPPFSYEDIENLYYTEEEVKENESLYLRDLNEETKRSYIEDVMGTPKEVLSWIFITDYLRYEFEQQKEVLIK